MVKQQIVLGHSLNSGGGILHDAGITLGPKDCCIIKYADFAKRNSINSSTSISCKSNDLTA